MKIKEILLEYLIFFALALLISTIVILLTHLASAESSSICEYNLNKNITIINANLDLDSSIPFVDISIGNPKCSTLTFLRWIFKIEQSSDYSIQGIKVYLVSSVGILILIFALYGDLKRKWMEKT